MFISATFGRSIFLSAFSHQLLFLIIVFCFLGFIDARYGHSTVYLSSLNQLYVFGGLPNLPELPRQLTYTIPSGPSTFPFTDLTNIVGNPEYASCISLPVLSGIEFGGFHVICLGGASPSRILNKPYVFNQLQQKWAPLLTSTISLPPGINGIGGAILDDKAVFFGGKNGSSVSSDIITFGPFPSLTSQTVAAEQKFGRANFGIGNVDKGVIVGFGNNGASVLSSVFLITRANTIVEPTIVGLDGGPSPSPREGVTAVNISSTSLLFYGGKNGDVYFNEIWKLDTSEDEWSWKLVSNELGSERAYHTSTMVGRIMVVWGGQTTGATALDDVPMFFDTTLEKWVPAPNDFFAVVTPSPTTKVTIKLFSQTPASSELAAVSSQNSDSGSQLGLILGVCGAVLVVIGLSILLFVRRSRPRKRSTPTVTVEEISPDSPPPYAPSEITYMTENSDLMLSRSDRLSSVLETGTLPSMSSYHRSSRLFSPATPIPDSLSIPSPPTSPTDVVRPMSGYTDATIVGMMVRRPTMHSGEVIAKGVCIAGYKQLMADEIGMSVGESVEVMEFCEDGWGYGKVRESTGYFPLSCVRIIDEKVAVAVEEV